MSSSKFVRSSVVSRTVVQARKRITRTWKQTVISSRTQMWVPHVLHHSWTCTRGRTKITDFLRMITGPQKKLSQRKTLLSISLVINVWDHPSSSTSQSLIPICRFLDSITTEVLKRTAADKTAVLLNVPDRMPLEMVKSCNLNVCGKAHHKWNCTRLRESCNATTVPYFSNFQMSLHPNNLSTTVKLLPNRAHLLKLLYLPIKIPCKRRFLEDQT